MTLEVNLPEKGALGRLFLACTAAAVVACAPETTELFAEGEAQGTTFVVRAYGDSLDATQDDIARWLAAYNRAASAWDPESELSVLNTGGEVQPSEIITDLLLVADALRTATDSVVEPALEPVLQAWGFSVGSGILPTAEGPARDSAVVDSLLARLRWESPIRTENGGIRLPCPLNVNAFAQGHSVDLLVDSLRAHGATAAFVEVGGEVRAYGRKPSGDGFTVGIEKPLTSGDRSLQLSIELEDRALATSGNYRKFQTDPKTGVKYGHSLDPRTGWPARTDLLSATLIGPTCAEADAFATMSMVKGLDWTMAWLAQHPEWDAILIYGDAQGAFSVYDSRTPY